MNGSGIPWSGRVPYLSHIKSSSLVLYCERDCIRFTAETNIDVFSGILMISVNDRVCESFAQGDLNVALALSSTAALPDQSHEFIHEGEIAATLLGKERSRSRQGP